VEREGETDRSDAEHLHDLDGGDAGAVPVGVLAELAGSVAGDVGDGDLARVDIGVDGERHKVAEAVHSAAQEIEARAEVGHGGRRKGLDGGQYGFGFGDLGSDRNREVAAQRLRFGCGGEGDGGSHADGLHWSLEANGHCTCLTEREREAYVRV